MGDWKAAKAGIVIMLFGIGLAVPLAGAAEEPQEQAVRYVLATVQAFRMVYVEYITEHVKQAGIHPKEDWGKDPHAIMLPFQLVKLAAVEIKSATKNLQVGIISLTPIYSSNFPETEAEAEALKTMMKNQKPAVLTFADGNQFKGLAADFAIEQACADCHNHHPNSPKKDFKKGDLMGAIIVRLKR